VWTDEELEYLGDHYGLVSDATLCRHLQRSRSAIVIAARRKLQMRQKDNFYSAAELARVLGVRDPKSILLWVKNGWLRGRRGPMMQGLNYVWAFSEGAIVECLTRRPWLANMERLSRHYFRSVVREEWERDPWFTPAQACAVLGVASANTVCRYICQGWLPAEKKPGGPHQGVWIIRQSAINSFLEKDPRPGHLHSALSSSRKRQFLAAGRAIRLSLLWQLRCPSCGATVQINAPPALRGPQVREAFLGRYGKGACQHSGYVNLFEERKAGEDESV
jgi:hypothetical protein